jgi:tRNA A-37 threonylcarbamoyl transferase component Bud32
MMDCVDDNTLALFVQGRLPAHRMAQVESHVDRCADCTLLLVYFGRSFGQDDPANDSPYRSMPDVVAPALPSVGSHLGRFAIVHRVASGGMGVVFTAFDPVLNRRVAIKLVRQDVSRSEPEAQRGRVLREARAMARLSHPNVLAVYDVGTFADQVFIAMELVEGVTLDKWLALEARPSDVVLDAMLQAGRGLAAAHQAGIVHGDFKPENTLVTVDGRVRVMDFGLARAEEETPASRRALEFGLAEASVSCVGGTLAYMAPEQIAKALGEGATGPPTTTPKSDQYAFCVVLYEALYGQRPFAGSTPESLLRSQRQMRPGFGRRSDVPDWVPAVLSRGLEPHPNDRYARMNDLLDALGGEGSRRAFAHVRATAVLLAGMWVIHVVWAGFALPIMIARAAQPPAPSEAGPTTLDVGVVAGALVLLGWVPLGLFGAPINAAGLLLRKGWARVGTIVYALLSLPTCIGTPFAVYALWTMTRPAVRRHVFDSSLPAGPEDPSRDARLHVRTNMLLQLGMWVTHAVLMVFVVPLLVHMIGPSDAPTALESKSYGAFETVFLSFMALVTLLWVPLGTLWTACNALGLWRGRPWARWSTLGYAVLSLPTALGTPVAVYALWSLTRPGIQGALGGKQ